MLAVGTLSVVRVPVPGEVSGRELRASAAFYPLVGLLVGAFPAGVLLLPLPPLPRAALALAVWVAVTGALHLDGWADCCDAAFAPARPDPAETRARRLAILRDPHVGVFGAAGLVLLLLGKWTALAYAPAAVPLLAAPVARWGMTYTLSSYPAARPEGLGAAFAGRVPLWTATGVLAVLLIPPLLILGDPLRVALAASAGIVAAALLARFLAGRFGGVTGDVCGAAGEAAELAVLWAFLPWGSG